MKIYIPGSTVSHQFNTRDKDGNPITFAGSPTLAVRKNVETLTNTDGLTLVIDSGSVIGLHTLNIDTSQNSSFYATGNDFFVIVTAGTVDGNSVAGEIVLEFKLGEVPTDVKKWNGGNLPDVATQSDINNLNDVSVSDIWDEPISNHNIVGTFGAKNQKVVPSENVNDYKADVSTLPTSEQISDAVWDEPISNHNIVGTFGAKNQKVVPSENVSDYKADVSTLPTSEQISDAVWDEPISNHNTVETFGAKNQKVVPSENVNDYKADVSTLADILEDTSVNLPGLISEISLGSGSVSWPYTLTDSVTGLPISSADIWVSTDLEQLNIVAYGRTDSYGVVTFNLDPGTVYIWRQKIGYTFDDPDIEVVT